MTEIGDIFGVLKFGVSRDSFILDKIQAVGVQGDQGNTKRRLVYNPSALTDHSIVCDVDSLVYIGVSVSSVYVI